MAGLPKSLIPTGLLHPIGLFKFSVESLSSLKSESTDFIDFSGS